MSEKATSSRNGSIKSVALSQKQRDGRGKNPNSRANLKPFKPGQSGNPGGWPKGRPRVSAAYARLLAMTPEELSCFKPSNGAEEIAYAQIRNALKGKHDTALASAREIADRTEGKAKQTVEVQNISEIERLIIRVQERVLAQTGIELSREEAIEQIIAYRPELTKMFEAAPS